MDLQLAGKNVLVTGAGQGVGLRIGEAFAAEGANVAFAYNSSNEGAEQAAMAAQIAGRSALAVQADIASAADVERLVATVDNTFGSIDVLINNAAYTEPGAFLDLDADALVRMVEVTVVGTFRLTQTVVGRMVARGEGRLDRVAHGRLGPGR